MKSIDKDFIEAETYYYGVIDSAFDENAFKEITSDFNTLALIADIMDLTENTGSSRPILLPKAEEGSFKRGIQPYYFCKNEQDAIKILSSKIDIFMLATEEKSTEIPIKICLYGTEKTAVEWSSKEDICSFEDLLKSLFHIPKPLFNKKNSAGIYLNTQFFLQEKVLVNYQNENIKAQEKPVYFRLVWSEYEEKVLGFFSVGDFVTRK